MYRTLTIRRSDRALALAVAATVFAWLAFASPVSADPPGAPGNNGTVKIHEMPGEAEPIVRNEPKVCQFHVHAFFLDENQQGDWKIEAWAPTADNADYPATGTRTYAAESSTNGRDFEYVSETIQLTPGHYKLFFEGRGESADGAIRGTEVKHKVFWVECEDTSGGGNGGGGNGGGGNGGGGGGAGGGGAGTAGGGGGAGTAGTTGSPRGAVAGSVGGPAAGNLPNTAVPMDLAGSVGGLLVILSGIAYTVARRRDS